MRKKIICLPGTMCDERLWSLLNDELAARYELVHFPIPLHQNFDDMANALNDFIGAEKALLMGFSLGGYLASYFATRFPHRIEKLLVVSNSPCTLPDPEVATRESNLKLLAHFGYKGIRRSKAAELLDPARQNEDLINRIVEMDQALGELTLISQLQHTTQRDDLAGALVASDVPMAFYFSEDDPLIQKTWFAELTRLAPLTTIHTTPGSGHLLPLETPCELAAFMAEWFE